jgi:hypothetical protein
MKVKELIENLREFNPDVDVLLALEGGFKEVESVCYTERKGQYTYKIGTFPESICVIIE